jgi:peptidoglycan/LPS O-acetylase OafA/YrhL
VIFHHIHRDAILRPDAADLPHWFSLFGFLRWGHYAVDVFIVLSGYCLMLPVAARGELPGGVWHYVKRRARRILPPYYAAIAFSLLLIAAVPGLRHPVGGTPADTMHTQLPAFSAGAIVPHLLLIHNLRSDWVYKIDGPSWSVATEWQIYFFFPMLLLPVWKRFGTWPAVAAGVLLGIGVHFVPGRPLDIACPWFLGLFAMGMGGAIVNFRPASDGSSRRSLPWGALGAVAAALVAAACALKPDWTEIHFYLVDPVVGFATAAMLVALTRALQQGGRRGPLLRILDSPLSVWLGIFSYSLYLIHRPLLLAMEALYTRAHLSPIAEFTALCLAGAPAIAGAAYVFHRLFERRFMNLPSEPSVRLSAAPGHREA